MNKILPAVLLLFFNSAFGQSTFQRAYGGTGNDKGLSVQQTTDGGFIMVGYTESFGAGSSDVYLVRTKPNGDTLWTKTYGGTGYDACYCVQQTTDGGYILTGYTRSFALAMPDVYLIKTDAAGDTLWTKTYGGANDDGGYAVRQTTDGGYVIAGYTSSFGSGMDDVYLIKTTAAGDTLWTKAYGGISEEDGWSVEQTTDGGYIISGSTYTFGAGSSDVYLIKTTAAGDTLWTRTFGGANYDEGYWVQQTTDGGYIVTGYTASFGAGSYDVYLIRTNSGGDTLWTKTYGGTGVDEGESVQQTTDGGYIIAGTTYSFGAGSYDIYLIKTDSSGDTLWTKTYGGTLEDDAWSAQQTADSGYIVTGPAYSFGVGSADAYLIKTDANGNSDCNERNAATIVITPPTIVGSTATVVSSTNTIVKTPATIVGNGGVVTAPCSVGVSEIQPQQSSISIYPNPAHDNFTITINEELGIGKWDLGIYDVTGRVVHEQKIHSQLSTVNCQLNAGIYFVKVTAGKRVYAGKLVVE
jgi:hypothetical protein